MYNLFFKGISTGFSRLDHFYNLSEVIPFTGFKCCNNFLCHGATILYGYLISLWRVTFLRMGLNFFNSKRSSVFFLFLVVIYLEVPGLPLSLCSVHSSIT